MILALYTSRVILEILGETDFGVYNVVGGVVTMFSFLTSTLASASQRYLSYDLTSNNPQKLRETFGLIMLTYILMSLLSVILIESVAVWFVNKKMTIPIDRLNAANWVLQISILTYIAHVFTTPYLSVVIAHEKMDVYAYISIIEAFIKLGAVFLLEIIDYDKLIMYAFMLFLCSLFITFCYIYYCMKNYKESHCFIFYERNRLKNISSYIFWNAIGSIAGLLRSQGVNLLLNIFFNPAINAARAIAYQVHNAINSFSHNFYTAVRPQIIKTYAVGEIERMNNMIISTSRLAFYLLLVVSIPIMIYTESILNVWLDTPPAYADIFVKLILINALVEVFNLPLAAGVQASGNLKSYQIAVFSVNLLNFPVSYCFLYYGAPPEITVYVSIGLALLSFIPRLIIAHKRYNIHIFLYIKSVLFRVGAVAVICYFCGHLLAILLGSHDSVLSLLMCSSILIILQLVIVYMVGFPNAEKKMILNYLTKKIRKR